MKKQLLILAFLLINTLSFSQGNATADLKFEQAEEAFNNNDYALTIKKVNEFEKAFGNMTSKSLYLRIVSQKNLFNSQQFYEDEKQFTLYTSLSANIDKYLASMGKKGLDDKYREIASINEELKELNFPKTKAGWQKGKNEVEKQRKIKEEKLNAELKRNQDWMLAFALQYGYKPNITIEEYAALSPENKAMADKKGKTLNNGEIARDNTQFFHIERGPFYLKSVKNPTNGTEIISYLQYIIEKGGYNKRIALYNSMVSEIEKNIDKKYIKHSTGDEYHTSQVNTDVIIPGLGLQVSFFTEKGSTLEIHFITIEK